MVMLRWWFMFCVSVVVLVLCGNLGLYGELQKADATYIGFVCLGLYTVSSVWIGWATKTASHKSYAYDKHGVDRARKHLPLMWLVNSALLDLGMLGTLIGIVMMLTGSGFETMGSGNVAEAQKALVQMSLGMCTAVATTLVGLACSTAMKFQLVNLESIIPNAE